MSFDKRCDNRWENVIVPAIKKVGLKPYRVDMKTISDSIMTEIVSTYIRQVDVMNLLFLLIAFLSFHEFVL